MSDKEWEAVKVDIRCMLLTQKESTIDKLRKGFKEELGHYLPFKKFGFNSDLEFLQSMPDVVQIRSGYQGLVLSAIADKNTAHIQKLVAKQKTTKGKSAPPSRYVTRWNDAYRIPPRFNPEKPVCRQPAYLPVALKVELNRIVSEFTHGINLTNIMLAYKRKYNREIDFQTYGFPTLEACVRANPDLILKSKDTGLREQQGTNLLVFYNVQKDERADTRSNQLPLSNKVDVNPMSKSTKTVPHTPPGFPSMKAVPTSQTLSSSRLNETERNSKRIDSLSEFPDAPQNTQPCAKPEYSEIPPPKKIGDEERLHPNESEEDQSGISDAMKRKFQKVLEKYPMGLSAQDFPMKYEEIFGEPFDLHSLSYYSLNTLIDNLPSIFQRKRAPGSKKDWFIYPVGFDCSREDSPEVLPSVNIVDVISNIRKILMVYSGGVKVRDILQLYNSNYEPSLDLDALGFDNIEAFLKCIDKDVPLVFQMNKSDGTLTIHHMKYARNIPGSHHENFGFGINECPADIVSPCSQYTLQQIPEDLSKCIPIFISVVINPHHLYIQLRSKETDGELMLLSEELDEFYYGPDSPMYEMKDCHVMVGAICAAKWPSDHHWYRVKITSIPSLEFVEVCYVDFGNTGKIPRTLLKYLRKQYFSLPSQALRATLSNIQPPNGSSQWDSEAGNKLLAISRDKPLLAYFKIQYVQDKDDIPILAYDVAGADGKEVFLNGELVKEGYAEEISEHKLQHTEESYNPVYMNGSVGVPNYPQNNFAMQNPIMQAAASNCSQAISHSEKVLNDYLKQLRDNNPILRNMNRNDLLVMLSSMPKSSANYPFVNPNAMANFQPPYVGLPMPYNAFQQPYGGGFKPIHSNAASSAMSQTSSYAENSRSGPYFDARSTEAASSPQLESCREGEDSESDSEAFVDDDDDFFKALCEDVDPFAIKKIVRRIKFADGYKMHIVVVDKKPYVSCGDVSALLWKNEHYSVLSQRLDFKEIVVPMLTITEKKDQAMFEYLSKYKVKGIQHDSDSGDSISLHPLKNVIDILNLFGHPSRSIREEVDFYAKNFNPEEAFIDTSEETETEEEEKSETDHDKINKLCSYDLKTMREAMYYRKLMILRDLKEGKNASGAGVDDIKRIENLGVLINKRINEIEELSFKS